MLRPLRLTAFAFVTSALLACGQSQTAPSEENQDLSVSLDQESLREEALAGALLIVASYFQDDPEVFIGHLASDLPTLGGPTDWVMGKDEFSISVRAQVPFPAGLDLSQYTLEDYHQTFSPKVLTYQEAVSQAEVDKVHDDGWVPAEGELESECQTARW